MGVDVIDRNDYTVKHLQIEEAPLDDNRMMTVRMQTYIKGIGFFPRQGCAP